MANDTSPPPTSKLATISTMISSAAAVVAAACAIISTNQVLRAVQVDAREKVFALKLDACASFDEVTTTLSTNPMVAASEGENRQKIIRSANRLNVLFPDHVRSAGLKFINQMDIVYAARHGGSQGIPLNMKLGSVIQASIDLEQACQDDITSAQGSV